MIICETEFKKPDPNNPDYCIDEVDMKTMHGYRVSLRKNLRTGEFEVIHTIFGRPPQVQVVKSTKSLKEALDFTNSAYDLNDQACQHTPPIMSDDCEYEKGDE